MVVVLHCVARQDSMVGTLSITLDILNSCELNFDMIFSGKRIRYKIKIGKKMKIETGYVLFCLYHSEYPVSRWCVHVNNRTKRTKNRTKRTKNGTKRTKNRTKRTKNRTKRTKNRTKRTKIGQNGQKIGQNGQKIGQKLIGQNGQKIGQNGHRIVTDKSCHAKNLLSMVYLYAHGGRTSLRGSSRLDGRYTEHHLGYFKFM